MRAELIRLLAAGDGQVAPAAAIALGVPGNRGAIGALARALEEGGHATRMAAIRALGAIGGPEAAAVLERAAAEHADAEVRRRAGAETRRPGGG